VQQRIGEVESKFVGVPKEIIKDERDILNRSIMGGERIQKQVMAERFENKEWTLNERIVAREIMVVPNPLALQSRCVNENSGEPDNERAKPVALTDSPQRY
jgi:hypothetical protein